jgi:branched-chain amino acid aminotransferase
MLQMFGAGTACVVAPVNKVLYKNKLTKEYENLHIPTMETKNNIMMRFYDTINDVMYGRAEWPGWMRTVC